MRISILSTQQSRRPAAGISPHLSRGLGNLWWFGRINLSVRFEAEHRSVSCAIDRNPRVSHCPIYTFYLFTARRQLPSIIGGCGCNSNPQVRHAPPRIPSGGSGLFPRCFIVGSTLACLLSPEAWIVIQGSGETCRSDSLDRINYKHVKS